MNSQAPSTIRRTLLATAVAAVGIGSLQPAVAQSRTAVLEEIIVTARKTEESIQNTPISMAAFSTQKLEQIGAFEPGAVADYTPNVRMQKQTSSQDNYSFSIRGVSASETTLTTEPTVGLYMDGVYIARSTGAAFDIVDLERIEVLRGPQGTLFGRNTIGGALNIVTEKPRGDFGVKQLVSVGNRDYVRTQTTIDTPQMGDFAAKFSHMYTEKDRALKSVYTDGVLGESESQAFRLALRWTPTDDLTVDYVYDKSDRESSASLEQFAHIRPAFVGAGGPAYQQALGFSSQNRISHLPVSNSDRDDSDSDIDGSALTVEWLATDDLTLKSITSYREWKSGVKNTDFGSIIADGSTVYDLGASVGSIMGGGGPVAVPAGSIVPLFGASRESAQRQFTQEFQAVGYAFDQNLRYNVGLYYFEEQANEDNPQQLMLPTVFALGSPPSNALLPAFPNNGLGSAVVISQPNFQYATDNKSYAAYGEFTYSFTYDFEATLGLRYTVDEKETTLFKDFNDLGLTTLTDDESWSNFSPSLTLSYNWNETVNTYAKIASGYRAGGYNARASTEPSFRSPVDEEELVSYELGLKSDWFDRSLRVNAAYFLMDYTDRQIAQFEAGQGGAATRIVNAGETTTQGVEMDVTWLPTPGAELTLSYGWLDVDYEEFESGVSDPVTGFPVTSGGEGVVRDISDEASETYYAPEHSAALIARYSFEPWSFGQLSVSADVTYVSDFTFHPQLNLYDRVDEHHLVNARATLADIPVGREGTLRISAWGKNLENKHYREFGIDFGSLGFAVNTYGELRRWGLDFVYEYGR